MASRCWVTAAEYARRFLVWATPLAMAASFTRIFAASLAGAIFRGGLRGAVLDIGRPGAFIARMVTWGPAFQLSSTNLASPGRIFSMAPSILVSSSSPSCLKEHRGFVHFPKNR